MHKNKLLDKIANFLRFVYLKLVRIDDTPHKIAAGFGLGVFAGIMPFAGPIAAIFLAMLFRVNRASAFLGGLLTNTWITLVAFFFSIKVGAFIFGLDGNMVRQRWVALLKDLHLSSLFKLSVFQIALPVITGYIVISLLAACGAYVVIMVIIKIIKNSKEAKKREKAKCL